MRINVICPSGPLQPINQVLAIQARYIFPLMTTNHLMIDEPSIYELPSLWQQHVLPVRFFCYNCVIISVPNRMTALDVVRNAFHVIIIK